MFDRVSVTPVELGDRKLSVFFQVEQTRYLVDATGVLEVARMSADTSMLHGNLELIDFTKLVGGAPLAGGTTALVFDTSPTLATRVSSVEGVFDASALVPLVMPARLAPLLSPVVRGAVLHEHRVYFDVDPDRLSRGLHGTQAPLGVSTAAPTSPCLVFESGEHSVAVPLSAVRQIISSAGAFNPLPRPGPMLGVIAHERMLYPAYSVSGAGWEPLVVLVETLTEPIGLLARRADGVRPADALGSANVLDLAHMFS